MIPSEPGVGVGHIVMGSNGRGEQLNSRVCTPPLHIPFPSPALPAALGRTPGATGPRGGGAWRPRPARTDPMVSPFSGQFMGGPNLPQSSRLGGTASAEFDFKYILPKKIGILHTFVQAFCTGIFFSHSRDFLPPLILNGVVSPQSSMVGKSGVDFDPLTGSRI